MNVERESGTIESTGHPMFPIMGATGANMEILRTLGAASQAPTRNLAEELYRRLGPFDFEKNETRQ